MKQPASHHGLLLMDKPKAWTSHDLVAFVRKSLRMKEVGHCGTLDPLASGLMVVLLGEGTKVSNYILDQDKTYEVHARLGIETDTFDMDGKVVAEKPVQVSTERLAAALARLTGALELPVPIFSAVKVDGQKLYEKARRNEDVVLPVKTMEFKTVELLGFDGAVARVRISCSKGSFIRAWVQELGKLLETGATVQELRRLRSEPYSVERAITVENLKELVGQEGVAAEPLSASLIGMGEVLPHWKILRADGFDAHLLINGTISHHLRARLMAIFKIDQDPGVKIVNANGVLLALIGLEKGKGFVIRRVFRH